MPQHMMSSGGKRNMFSAACFMSDPGSAPFRPMSFAVTAPQHRAFDRIIVLGYTISNMYEYLLATRADCGAAGDLSDSFAIHICVPNF